MKTTGRKQSGIMLIELLVYLSLWIVILNLAGAAFFRVLQHTRALRRVSTEISRVLRAGEQWRHDVRLAVSAPELAADEDLQVWEIRQETNQVAYRFAGRAGVVYRRVRPEAQWQPLLSGVKSSQMINERGTHASSCRWEIELIATRKNPVVRPLFSFRAARPGRQGE